MQEYRYQAPGLLVLLVGTGRRDTSLASRLGAFARRLFAPRHGIALPPMSAAWLREHDATSGKHQE